MSRFIQDEARHQTTLFPEALDNYITEENLLCVIDAFADSIDLSGLAFKTTPAGTGRPAYHTSMMLKLFIIRSSPRPSAVSG
ncbi:MAG: hypothetical protein DRQ44_04980 [Gammaproteobacteria bacterium]|nr:MAG: hypothetical protein DRQ44_04980 [Gammaproteobacteria bacterium]